MGQAGLISRIIAKKLDSFVTFASIDEKNATAPGQLAIQRLKRLYRYDCVDSDTELFGVIADPLGHSLSPAIHNACFADKGMNKLYLPLLVQGGQGEFDRFLDNVLSREWLNFRGFSVTIPHKENALNYVRQSHGFVEPLAEKVGAVNTLIPHERRAIPAFAGTGLPLRRQGDERRISAYNTDYTAALDAIALGRGISRADLQELPVAVIGAGGVARAIVAGLSGAGARIKIYNRTIEKAERLAAEFGCEFAGLDDLPALDAKLVINCTSIGMYPNVDETPVPAQYLKKGMVVFDTVYNPAQTLLLKQAKKKKLKTIDGLSMFINQALAQFKLFTGQDGDASLMRKVVFEYLSKDTNG
jgi:3-dehydroquinate dehydratase/shikimate dehydrogenase